jgi:hypothetical protein
VLAPVGPACTTRPPLMSSVPRAVIQTCAACRNRLAPSRPGRVRHCRSCDKSWSPRMISERRPHSLLEESYLIHALLPYRTTASFGTACPRTSYSGKIGTGQPAIITRHRDATSDQSPSVTRASGKDLIGARRVDRCTTLTLSAHERDATPPRHTTPWAASRSVS